MFTSIVYAQTSSFAESATQGYSFESLVTFVVSLLVLVAIVMTIVFVLWGGFLLVISGGDEHKVHPAINMIRYSVVGLLLIAAIILVMPAISSALGFSYIGENFRPSNIGNTMKCIFDRAFGKTDQDCFVVADSNGVGSTTTTRTGVPTFSGSRSQGGNSPNGAGNWSQDI